MAVTKRLNNLIDHDTEAELLYQEMAITKRLSNLISHDTEAELL